jgi:hypothetical protein
MPLVTTCPRCKVQTQFTNRVTYGYYQLWGCSVCGQIVYYITNTGNAELVTAASIQDRYPKIIPGLDKAIPQKITKDMIEAYICFDNKCFKASLTMMRRALQNAVRDKGAKGKTLYDEINNLADKHIITPDLKDWAHEIRELGKIGAHPDDDGLDEVTEKDAEDMLKFAEEFLKYTYVMPAQVMERRTKKK